VSHPTPTAYMAAYLEELAHHPGLVSASPCAASSAFAAIAARLREQEATEGRLVAEIERWRVATAKLRDASEEAARVANEHLARAESRVAELELTLQKIEDYYARWLDKESLQCLDQFAKEHRDALAKHGETSEGGAK